MHTYTLDELRALFGISDQVTFEDVVDKLPPRKGLPPIYKLKTPLDIGEKRKAVYLISLSDRGWGFFPTLASAKLWNQEQAQWVAA